MSIPNITVKRFWNARNVKEVCIDNKLYTCGDNESYNAMLNRVDECSPTTENLYLIAVDIAKHSTFRGIESIMYMLENGAVKTYFSIEEN